MILTHSLQRIAQGFPLAVHLSSVVVFLSIVILYPTIPSVFSSAYDYIGIIAIRI